jgi:hypothetical protein
MLPPPPNSVIHAFTDLFAAGLHFHAVPESLEIKADDFSLSVSMQLENMLRSKWTIFVECSKAASPDRGIAYPARRPKKCHYLGKTCLFFSLMPDGKD